MKVLIVKLASLEFFDFLQPNFLVLHFRHISSVLKTLMSNVRNEKSKVIQVICLNLLYGLFQVKKSETIKSQEAELERKC